MIPRSLSASALKTAESCPARYYAENIQRGAKTQGTAANLGITLHAALEAFIMGVKIRKDTKWDQDVLLGLYDKAFTATIGADRSVPEYRDGRQILINWFARDYIFDDIIGSTVLSVESKNNFPMPVNINGQRAEIPFNYIFDRLDRIGPGEYRVVDYKSNRQALTADELRSNIQARVYAVAVQIKYKDAQKIWVEFDFLRHEKIGVLFTKDDNIDSWKMMRQAAQTIIDTDENHKLPERLNPECIYCVRKATCETLQSNVNVGGAFALSLDEQAIIYHDLNLKIKAMDVLKNDLEKQLLLHAANNDVFDFDTDRATVKVGNANRRQVDTVRVEQIVGPVIAAQYPGMRLGDVDEIIRRPDLSDAQKAAVKSAVTRTLGKPTVKVSLKK